MKKYLFALLSFLMFSMSSSAQGEFVTVWNLSNPGSGANQITFNATVATGGANFTWETIPSGTSGSGTLAAGTSLRTITGIPAGATIRLSIEPQNLQRFFFNNGGDRQRITDIENWGAAAWTSMENAFYGCNNLNISATDIPNLTGVTSMANMFRSCSSLNGPANIGQWNVSTVLDMQSMFRSATVFNQNVGTWNVANVLNMFAMFRTASSFNQNLGSWTLNNAVNLGGMLESAGLSCENYSNTLIGWAANNPSVTNRSLTADGLQFGFHAVSARNTLVTFRGWTITDNGVTACGDEYRTVWNMANSGSGATQITFNSTIASGGAQYYWETIPAGTSGSGTLAAGTSLRTISGIPTGVIIRLHIAAANLQQFQINAADRLRLIDVEAWGGSAWSSMAAAFFGCSNLQISAIDIPNLNNVSSLQNMFFGCSSLNGPLNINSWNTSNVTNMQGLFRGASAFNQNINNWNTQNVTNMRDLFYQAYLFNQPLNNWNVSSVTNMQEMFKQAYDFNQPLDNWNTANVQNMYGLFNVATSFNQNINSWNTSSVTNMGWMFLNASSFNQPLDLWNVNNVLNFDNTIATPSFNQNIGSWIFSSNVSLYLPNFASGVDCDNYSATLIGWAQNNPSLLNKVLSAPGRTYKSSALAARNQLLSQGWNISDAGMTGPCNAFNTVWNMSNSGSGANQITFNATVATGGANYTWETIPAGTSGSGTLTAGTSLRTIAGIPAGVMIRLSIEPQNLQRFFFNNGGDMERIVDIEQWGAAPWTSMQDAFYGCSNLNISATDVPILTGVNNMAQMFRNCTSLNGPANIGQWNVSTVNDMQSMFRSASSFNRNVSTWNVSSVLNMFAMFRTATAFNQSLGPWVMSNAVNLTAMLEGAGMDCETYSNTLIGWAANNPTAFNLTLDAQGIGYGMDAIAARNTLVNTRGWTINDAGIEACGAFVTTWDLNNPGTGANQIVFNTVIAPGGLNYYWETIPSGTTGSGTLPAGSGLRTISGIPAGANIRLYLSSTGLQRFSIQNSSVTPPPSFGTDRLRLIDVEAWGKVQWNSMGIAFYGASNLNISATDIPNLSNVWDMGMMFAYCTSLTGPSNINDWNVSTITKMSDLFNTATQFNQPLGNWNTSNVTLMNGMFHSAASFNQNISNWNTGNVVNMNRMFMSSGAFNQPIGIWNTNNVTDMYAMFNSSGFNQPIDSWNVSNVTNMMLMLNGALNFNQNIGSWVFNPGVSMIDMLSSTGMNCENLSTTLMGWAANNPTLNNRNLGIVSGQIAPYALYAKNQLLSQGWIINGANVLVATPALVAANQVETPIHACAPFVRSANQTQKLLTIEENGNAVEFSLFSVFARNAFVPSVPPGVTMHTSGPHSGYYNLDNGATNVFRVSRRMYTIETPETFPNNGGVLVRLYYHPNDFSSMINDPASVPINDYGWYKSSYHNTEALISEMSLNEPMLASAQIIENVTYGVENGVNYAEFFVESFSTFGMFAKHKSGPLPVTLTAFNAHCQGENIQLSWSTASEFNASHYNVQMSRDGFTWNDLGRVEAVGTSNQASNYSFEAQNFGGLNYFRLEQIDLDGKTEIFGPVSADCKSDFNVISVSPNPSSDFINVEIQANENFGQNTIQLVDLSGRVVLTQDVEINNGNTSVKLNIQDMKPGVYMLSIQNHQDKFNPLRLVKF